MFLLTSGCFSSDQQSGDTVSGVNEYWQHLDEGLALGTFHPVNPADNNESEIYILRIDPHHYQFDLVNASATNDGHKRSAKNWCHEFNLVSTINASMYQKDHKTSVSFMRSEKHINNAYISKDKTIFAFHPLNPSDPVIKLIDTECDDFNIWAKKYKNLVQSIRMISCKKENVWSEQPQQWSIAAIGIDAKQNVLFIHTPSSYRTHDFINTLLELPIHIEQAMYVEGGPEAQLYIKTRIHTFEFIGGYKKDYQGNSRIARPIPNVIGIKKLN